MAEWDVCFRFPCLSLNVDEEIHVLECIILFFPRKKTHWPRPLSLSAPPVNTTFM